MRITEREAAELLARFPGFTLEQIVAGLTVPAINEELSQAA